MPTRHRTLTPAIAAATIEAALAGDGRDLVGIEMEWPVHHASGPAVRARIEVLRRACREPLPAGGRVTVEPGGQVELSTLPAKTMDDAIDAVHVDTEVLRRRLERTQLVMRHLAVDTLRPPRRILHAPRYDAMEGFFAAGGDAGTWMMCNTASLQLNHSYHPVCPDRRWALAQRLGPVLLACFANSPGLDASGRRWESLRQAIWWSIDPSRTRPPCHTLSMNQSWLDYALTADVMLIWSHDGTDAAAMRPGMPFGRWMGNGHELGWPTADDLAYHLTTLFPPVRPRGWLELRMIDALPPALLEVAALVTATALTVEDVTGELQERLPETRQLWLEAARSGLAHPVLARGGRTLFDVVSRHVHQVTDSRCRQDAVLDFQDRFVRRGMSPAQAVGQPVFSRGCLPRLPALAPAARESRTA
jgi:glutamate--cysteine ligase